MPGIPPGAFGAVARTQPASALLLLRGQDGLDLPLPTLHPDIFLALDGQDIGLGPGLQPHPHTPIVAIDAVLGHPTGRNASRMSPLVQKAAPINHQYGVQICQIRHDAGAELIAAGVPSTCRSVVHGVFR